MITGAVWTWRDYGDVDGDAIALLERVLGELPADEALLRAAVTCVLATELQHDAAQVQRAIRLSTEATPVIRELGAPELQFHALVGHHRMLWVRELLDQRLAISEELLEMADRSGDLGDQAIAHVLRGSNRLELCDVDGGLADFRRAARLAQQAGIVPIRVIVGWAAATVPYLHGDFAAAARAVEEAEAMHSSITLVGGAHLSSLHRSMHMLMRGRLPDVAPQLKAVVERSGGRLSSWSEFYALALAQAGRLDEVRAFLGPWHERPPVPEDYVWTIATMNRAELYTLLGDQEAIASIRSELAPYRERLAYGGTGVTCQGLVRDALGWLAACAGDLDDGRERARVLPGMVCRAGVPGIRRAVHRSVGGRAGGARAAGGRRPRGRVAGRDRAHGGGTRRRPGWLADAAGCPRGRRFRARLILAGRSDRSGPRGHEGAGRPARVRRDERTCPCPRPAPGIRSPSAPRRRRSSARPPSWRPR